MKQFVIFSLVVIVLASCTIPQKKELVLPEN
jgi:hypothetical protein